jgi:small subunit ribosomal protein S20e
MDAEKDKTNKEEI